MRWVRKRKHRVVCQDGQSAGGTRLWGNIQYHCSTSRHKVSQEHMMQVTIKTVVEYELYWNGFVCHKKTQENLTKGFLSYIYFHTRFFSICRPTSGICSRRGKKNLNSEDELSAGRSHSPQWRNTVQTRLFTCCELLQALWIKYNYLLK